MAFEIIMIWIGYLYGEAAILVRGLNVAIFSVNRIVLVVCRVVVLMMMADVGANNSNEWNTTTSKH